MNKNRCIAAAWVAVCICSGCEYNEPVSPDSEAVLEAWIDSDGYPRVIFTTAFVDGDDQSIADKIVRWGRVTMSDGQDTITLTGGPDPDYFPPFSYHSYEMKGEPGRTYTVEASYGEMRATARCVMPPVPVIAEVVETASDLSDTLRQVTLRIHAPEQLPAYYHVSVRVLPEERCFLPASLGCAEITQPGEEIELPVYRGKTSVAEQRFTPQIPANRNVLVRVERIQPEIYRFWMNFNEATLFGGSLFVSTNRSLGGNITGGYGYFSAQGATVIRLPARQ